MSRTSRNYWLMKSEPDAYSIDHLLRAGRGHWDGVRSYQARNHLQAMRVGDLALFYHSSVDPPGVAGLARVVREAYPDHTQFERGHDHYDPKSKPDQPRWMMVDVEPVEKFGELVQLATLKSDAKLADMLVVRRGMRLSVQPVSLVHFKRVLQLARAKTRID
jgi:predicted RNA-binding protein with PUA-like domain